MERRLAPINNLLLTTEECLLCGKYDGWMTGIREEEKEEEKALQFRASTEYKRILSGLTFWGIERVL